MSSRTFSPQHLKDLRKAAGLTREDLAREIGTSYSSIATWEQGRFTPSADALAAIATALFVPIDDLFEEKS